MNVQLVTTVAFIGDPHVGNYSRFGGPKTKGINLRGELSFNALRDALRMARERGATLAVVLGDLVDYLRVEPQLLAAMRALFREMNAHGLRIILLKGNHDSASNEPGDCALFAVIEQQTKAVDVPKVIRHGGLDLVLVPFRSGNIGDWLPKTLEELSPPAGGILCLHAGVKDANTSAFLRDAPDAIHIDTLSALMEQYDLNECFCGNWHEHQVWEDEAVHQVGALCPTGFQNLGLHPYGHVALLTSNIDDVEYVTVPGPRFLKLGPDEHPKTLPQTGDLLFVEWHVAPDRFEIAKAELAILIEERRVFQGTVFPDSSGVRESLREAAYAAKQSVGIDGAIASYLDSMKLPPHLRKESVADRVRGYMAG